MTSKLGKDWIIAVDFDGTITTEPDMGHELELQPYCREVLEELYSAGVKLILWTCRTGSALGEASRFLSENGMAHMFSAVNDQLPEIYKKYAPDVSRKVGADFYLDDKNLGVVVDWIFFRKMLILKGVL